MYESTPYIELMFEVTVPLTTTLTVPLYKHVGLTVSRCLLTFTPDDRGPKKLRIRAVQTGGRNARILSLKFKVIDAKGTLWDKYRLDRISVCSTELINC